MPISQLTAASLISDNVIKPRGDPQLDTYAPDPQGIFDPTSVRPEVASGGFSCVVELSAAFCLRVFDSQFPRHWLPADAKPLDQLLLSGKETFTSAYLNDLSSKKKGLPADVALGVDDFVPLDLYFEDPHEVVITYQADVALFTQAGQEVPTSPGQTASSAPDRSFRVSPGSLAGGTADAIAMVGSPQERTVLPAQPALPLPQSSATPWMPFESLGKFRIQIRAPYIFHKDAKHRRVDVLTELSGATLSAVLPTPDAAKLLQAGILGKDASLLYQLLTLKEVRLTPTVAVVGRAPVTQEPVEFPLFDPLAIHVQHGRRQAIAVAINLKPSCEGIAEHVEHFIGPHDYGVISDALLVERLFRFRWRTGGLFGNLPLAQVLQVQRNKNVEDATLRGYLALDTLDLVSMEIEANSDKDVIKLAGQASVHVDYLELKDGTKVTKPSKEQPNFGAPKNVPWSFVAEVKTVAQYPSEPMLADFQRQAETRAFRHLPRPFANIPIDVAMIRYVRLTSVAQCIYYLGDFRSPFL